MMPLFLSRRGTSFNAFQYRTAVIALIGSITPSVAAVVDYPDFSNTTGITLNGAASVVSDSGSVIRLAPQTLDQTGSVWFNTRLDLLRGFSTRFTYNIHNGTGADGLTFILHNDPRGLGAIGGGIEGNQLGASGITNSVAVAIRTFIYNRIEVDACGQNLGQKIGGTGTWNLPEPYCTIGTPYQTSQNALRGIHTIEIDYVPGTLVVKLDGATVLTTNINIANYVNTPDGKVYVGFTGGTGASTDNHDIRSWSFFNLPNLLISKSHSGNFYQGQTNAQYQIVIKNIGDISTLGAVVAQDNLPAPLIPVSAVGSGWDCTTLGNFQCRREDTLAPGASYPPITLTVNVAIDAPPQVPNSATVTGGGGLTSSAGDLVQIDGRPDLTVTKSHTGNFIQGQQGTYNIVVTNISRAPTTNQVGITDVIPVGLTPVSASGNGWNCDPISGQTITCRRPDLLLPGESYPPITLVVVPSATAPANVTNTATVAGGGDINPANNTATDPTQVLGPPDLTILKSHNGNFDPGQSPASFTLAVSNVGATSTVGPVTVTDTLPPGFTPINATGEGWACSTSGQTISCTRSSVLAAGNAYPPITLSVSVVANARSTIANTAVVSGGSELNTTNNTSTDNVTINPAPDLTISKSHSGNFIQGQTGTYTINVSNISSVRTTGTFRVTDALPVGLTPISASGTDWVCAITGQTINCSREPSLEGGQSSSITVTVSVASNAPNSVTNPATVTGGGDISPENNNATDPTTILGGPDLTISKTHTGNFIQGQPGSYSITVSNVGQNATQGLSVAVLDTLPLGLLPVSASGNGWVCSLTGQVMQCGRSDSLSAGGSYPPITLTANVLPTATGNLANSATVSGGSDVNPNNNTTTDTVTITGGPDLTISKNHSGNFAQGQQGATYSLTIANIGASSTLGTVSISDTVPTGLTPTAATGPGWTCNVAGQNVSCTRVDALNATSSYPPITLTVNVAINAPSSVTNTVSVSGGGDVNPNNNTANDPTAITPQSDLTISKSHSGNFTQGQVGAVYSITVSNSGAGSTNGIVTVTESVPVGLTPISATGSGWSCGAPSGQTLTCTRADILSANSTYSPITLTVNVANNAPTSVINSVTVSGGGDVNPNNNTASDPTTIIPGPDPTISKSHIGNFVQGQQGATYTLTISNTGQSPTIGTVSISDTIPAGLTPTAAAGTGWTCNVAGQSVTCSRADALAASAAYPPITLTVNVAIDAPASVTNSIVVSGGGDVNPGNNTANDPTTITPQPDLTISKSHTSSFTQGQVGATYSITVSNLGSGPSSGTVTVTDSVPGGLTPISASGPGWTCPAPSGQTISCTRADALGNSAYPPITLTVNVASDAAGSLTNVVTVSGGGDINPSNNTAQDPTTIGAGPDLTISKNHSGNFTQGQQGATYSLVARNSGLAPTTGIVTITDVVPTGLTPVSASGTGWTCNVAGQDLTCTRSDALAAGASYPPIALIVNVANNAPASVTNPVTVSGGGDVNPNNNSANDPTAITPQPDLTISKSHSGNFIQGQSGATYSLLVSNIGTGATIGTVTVVDTIPAGLTPVSANGTGWICNSPAGQSVTCSRADVLAGSNSYPPITLTVNVANNAPASSINSVTVSGGGDINPTNNTASDPTTVGGGPDLTISKNHTGNFAQGQEGANYTITVSNVGQNATVGSASINDTVPAGLTPTAASGTGWSCTVAGQSVSCLRSDALSVNASYPPITITVNVAINAAASVINTVTVSGGNDVNPNNNSASDPTTITPQPDLTISKTHTNNFFQGQQGAVYTITVSNVGAASSAGPVTVSDTVPAGLIATSAVGTGWTCGIAGQTVTCNRADVLANGGRYPPITLSVNVSPSAPSSLINTASVSGGGDANPTNNTASDPTTVGLGPDPTISKSHTGNFMQGQQGALYTLTVTNIGVQSTNGAINVVDTVPTGLTITGASGNGWTCSVGGTNAACNRSDALGESASFPSITLTVNVAPDAPASLTNTAVVAGGGDINPANNTASDTTVIGAAPDLTISKSHTGNFTQGQSGAAFTLTATNVGQTASSGLVTIVDALPAGLTPVSASGTGWSCTIAGQAVTCTRSDSLDHSASFAPITVALNVASNASGNLVNTVNISGGGDVNNNNNTATDTVTIGNGPDLTITKTHVGNNFVAGQANAAYNLLVSNVGPAPTSETVTVQDTVPTGLTLVGAAGTGWSCTTNGPQASCSRSDSLNGNSSYPPIALTVNVASNAADQLINTAIVSGGGDIGTSNNSSTDTVNVARGPELSVTKTHVGNFTQGQTGAVYSITVSNKGASPTSGTVFVIDQLPTGLNPSSVDAPGWTTCTVGTRAFSCSRSDPLAPSASYSPIRFLVDVASDAPSSVTNTVRTSGGGDTNPNGTTASDTTTITGTPDVTITKVHFGDFIAGQQGVFLLTAHNRGAGPTSAPVTVTDVVPDAMTPISATGDGWNCSINGQTVSCGRSDVLDAGNAYPGISLIVDISLTAPQLVTNIGTIAGGGERNTDNNSVSDSVVVTPANFSLQIVKQVDQQVVQVGDIVTYQVIVTNPSKILIPASQLTDQPPSSFKYIAGTAFLNAGTTQQAIEPQTQGSDLIFPLGSLAPLTTVTLTYRLRVAATAGLGTHVNSAVAAGTLASGFIVRSIVASARVRVDGGVFTTSQFIIGRVFEDANRNQLFDTGDRPVAGVRLFLSNGQSVVTDSEGLYNIPSVGEGATVISLDPITLPKGFKLLDSDFRADQSWTRLLRTPLGSGGMLRQNFELVRTGASGDVGSTPQDKEPPALLARQPGSGGSVDRLEIETDRKELTADGRDSTIIRIKAFDTNNQPAADGRVMVQVSNGRLVGIETCDPSSKYNACSSGNNQALPDPPRAFQGPSASAATTSSNGSSQIMPMVPQAISHLGQTLVGTGSESTGGVAAEQINQNMQQQSVLLRNGEAQIRFISEAVSGRAQILAKSGDAESKDEVLFVSPQRSTVFVGLAQLSVGKAAPEAALFRNSDTTHEYAKFFFQSPLVSQKNLLTVAYDSNRPINRTAQQDRLFQLDPLANVYPLFGDSSTRYQVAQSNSHLFVRIDRGLSNIMFGDLRGATSTTSRPNNSFTAYQRNLTGVQLHLEDKEGSYLNAKGARPETAFARDILSADLYVFSHLSHQELLPGSENVVLETRDRRNPEIVLNRETLTRNTDYNIDYLLGTLFFQRRLATLDSALNLIQIVISYEFIVHGVQASAYDVNGEKRFSSIGLRLGASFVNQSQDGFGDFYLGGINGQQTTWKNGVIRAEGATSQGTFATGVGTYNYAGPLNTNSANPNNHNGFAYRASWEQPLGFAFSVLELKALKTGENFLNPFGPTTVPGSRQESATFKARPIDGSDLSVGFLDERNSSPGFNNQRRTFSTLWNQKLIARTKLLLGYNFRKFNDNLNNQEVNSNLFIAGLTWEPTERLKAGIRREQNATKADPTYPNSTFISATYGINATSRLFFTQRISSSPIVPISNVAGTGLGALASRNETSAGIETKWSQYTSFGTRYQVNNGINGTDSYAVIGLTNRLPLNNVLTLDSNFERALHLTGNNTSYNSFSLGVGWFPSKTFRATTRYQLRDQNGFGGTLAIGAAGKISEGVTMLARYQLSREAFFNSSNVSRNGTAALAIRPLKSDRVGLLFNYTVQQFLSSGTGFSPYTPTGIATLPFQSGNFYQPASPVFGPQSQLVQVLSSDGFWQIMRRLEFFGRVAMSYRQSSLPGANKISTLTYLTQGRFQYRFAKFFDAATELKWMAQPETDTHQYTTGTELGVWALRDLRVGLGYNFRSNIDYGVDFADPRLHRGFYFTMTSKMSRLFDLFGTAREGL